MFKTNKTLFLVFLIQLQVSCDISKKIGYPDCVSKNRINIYDLLLETFEDKLGKRYPQSASQDLYHFYLKELAEFGIERNFFLDNKTIKALDMLEDKAFMEIWKLDLSDDFYDETFLGEIPEDFGEFYIIDIQEKFFNCLIRNCNKKEIIEYFERISEIGEISTELGASVFLSFLDKMDYDNKSIRLIVAIKFYYEISLNML